MILEKVYIDHKYFFGLRGPLTVFSVAVEVDRKNLVSVLGLRLSVLGIIASQLLNPLQSNAQFCHAHPHTDSKPCDD